MNTSQKLLRLAGPWIVFSGILLVAFWIRIQGVGTIPDGQFTGNDPYLYYWQAQIVSEQGRLPARDMHRWLPLGRDLGQTLNAYSYAIAYAHKAITVLFPNVSLYHLALFAPTVCFVLGLGVLCLCLSRAFGWLFASIVGVLLATLPGIIERSTAGFSDRDSWCFLIGVLAVTTYLAALQTPQKRWRMLFTIASGISMFIGGISWEGFGVFLLVILLVEFWKFLTSETEAGLGFYLLWVLLFVPPLFLASPAYRSGEGFATHLFALMLVPPFVLLGLRSLRYLLITKVAVSRFRNNGKQARHLAFILTLVTLAAALGYFLSQQHTFATSTVSFSQNQLMETVGELNAPDYNFWVFRYGSVFFLGSVGLMIASMHLWKNDGTVLVVPLVGVMLTTFFRGQLESFLGTSSCTLLFFICIAGVTLGLLFIAWRRDALPKRELTYVAMAGWWLLWVALARDARRYDFFLGLPLAFFTADLLCHGASVVSEKLKRASFLSEAFRQRIPQPLLKIGLAVLMLTLLLFWTPAGEYAKRSLYAATRMRSAKPGNTDVAQAFQWMKTELPNTAIVAARWDYGSQLNVLAGVKTVTDQDHYIQHWIHLYNRHVLHAQAEREALEFLKTHTATHIMLTNRDPQNAFLRGQLSEAFVPVYPTENFGEAAVKVWALHYPPDIKPHPKYLATAPEE